jgi:purine-binding chemotaxis protein CheW
MSEAAIVPAAVAPTDDAPRLFVVFKVDEVDYALPADEVVQMESYSGATRVPRTEGFVTGIIQLRGRVIPVVDLRIRFGAPPSAPTIDSRVVVGERGGRTVALLADTAREVVRISPSQEKPPPSLVRSGGFVRSVVQTEDRTILVLDFAKVIGEEPIDV